MEISKEQIAKMAESYKKAETQHVAQRAVTKNGILESAESVEVLKRMSPKSFAFSIDVDDQAVANQKMSGRCWMFACLNVLRFHIEKELDLPKGTFELSQAYLAFFNKLERAAWWPRPTSRWITARSTGCSRRPWPTAATGIWCAPW